MWAAILAGSAGCFAIKLAGLSVPKAVLENKRVAHVAAVLPVALLLTLMATQTFTRGRHLTVDARAAGLAVGAVAVWRRAPFLVVVGLAAATAAAVRAVS